MDGLLISQLLSTEILSGGTIAVIFGAAGTILGLFLKFLLDKQKQSHQIKLEADKFETDWVEKEFVRLTGRIVELEKAYANCVKGEADRERIIGRLSGEVEGLKLLLAELQHKQTKQMVEHAVEKVTEKTETTISNAVERAVDAAVEKKNQ